MLSLTVLFTSFLVGFAAAQNSSSFDPNSVDLTTRNQWCQGEVANCPLLCGGQTSTKDNQCTGSSLSFTCTCANNSGPANIAQYQGTVPNFICEQNFKTCRINDPGSQSCIACGTLMPSDVQAAPASTAAPSSSSTSSASPTTTSATTTSASAKSNAGRVEGAMGGAAMGVVAALIL